MKDGQFILDIKSIRERARKHIGGGAVTAGWSGLRSTVIGR